MSHRNYLFDASKDIQENRAGGSIVRPTAIRRALRLGPPPRAAARSEREHPRRETLEPDGDLAISIEAAQPKLDLGVLRALKSKTVHVGVLDLNDRNVESAHQVAMRIRAALDVVPAERLIVTPDCGMKYLSREVAFGKLAALVAGAELVRAEL